MLAFLVLTAVTFSLFGFIIGIWADGFEKLQIIPMLIVTPLTFLGGSFYSINMLPPGWQTITLFNPVVYLISGFRWSFSGFAQEGFYAEMLPMQAQVGAAMAEHMKDTPMYKSYVAVAPKPQDFPRLLDRMGELMRKPYDWSEDVKKLTMPVMLVYGDSDMYRPEHIVKFYQLLGGGLKDAGWGRENMSKNRLAILPDLTHYDIFLSPELPRTVLPFLNGKSGSKSWAEQVQQKK
jgi:pimeloyl-ACP methyl ester carboxylesterase